MPRERTKPPTTAVNRVDFFLQNVMTSGESRRETPKHNPDKQPRKKTGCSSKSRDEIPSYYHPVMNEQV